MISHTLFYVISNRMSVFQNFFSNQKILTGSVYETGLYVLDRAISIQRPTSSLAELFDLKANLT